MKIPSILLTLGATILLQQSVLGSPFGGQSVLQARSLSDTEDFKPKLVSYEPKYKGHALVRFLPEAHGILKSTLANAPIDVWASRPLGEKIARLTPEQVEALRQVQGQGWEVVHEDLQDMIDKEAEAINRGILANHPYRRALEGDLERGRFDYQEWFKHYHRYEQIQKFAQQLVLDFPHVVQYIPSIGPQRTWEGRQIFALKITSRHTHQRPSEASRWVRHRHRKPQIWFQGVQHAREYISATTVQYLAHHYASGYGRNPTITSLLDRVEIVVILIANPDGYIHAWDVDRYWRKNKRYLGNNTYGVDHNRNWDDHWGGEGASHVPTAENYAGPSPASEPEIQALQGFFKRQGNVIAALDFHCYAELILRPLGWTANQSAAHEAELAFAAEGMRQAILPVHQQNFTSGRMADFYSPTSGSATDWFYGNSTDSRRDKVLPYSFTFELRPTLAFEDGFRLPEEQIVPAGEEIAAAMDWFIDHAVENPLLRK
ncbi:hypothetical protein DFQ27_009319 [Actinomortierella ambigua]|uniref:Peptidase M14 domain-containing protein n=1 Tax=Actinomortierella ambigua TaxID=1343610 RepID=A0A9P6PRL4_9FUNG|nr:hypothetical protein DFQ27_009319 [Actinomortierella ambigua]